MKDAAQRAVDAGIKVVAFDVNVENAKIPQVEQSDRDLARLALEQAIKDNGESWKAGYVYVAGIAPLDRRNETWVERSRRNIPASRKWRCSARSTTRSPTRSPTRRVRCIAAHPDITVMFAPYDEFAKGVKIAVDEAGLSTSIKIYSADISTSDIAAMREPDSAWAATAATNPAVVGQVSVRALAQLLAGEDPGHNVIVPPTLITQKDLIDKRHQEHGRARRPSCRSSPMPMSRCRNGCRCQAPSELSPKYMVPHPSPRAATIGIGGSLAAAPLPARLLLICRPPDGRGRHPTANVPGDFAADRGTTAATATSASMKRTIAIHSAATDGRSASKCQRK